MIYTIRAKDLLDELIDLLTEENFQLKQNGDHEVQVQVDTDKQSDIFTNIVAFYISYSQYGTAMRDILMQHGVSEEESYSMIQESLKDMSTSHYFYVFTRIVVKEYFKKMQVLNLDSFLVFNLRGFKDELKEFAKRLLEFKNGGGEFESEEGVSELPTSVAGVGSQELFETLRTRAESTGLKLEDFAELHVYQVGNYFVFKNKAGMALDEEFFINTMGSALQFETNAVENRELLEGVLVSSIVINIFNVRKVIIHQSVSERAKEIFLYNLNAMKKETGKRIKIVTCNGCDRCE